MPQVFIRGPLVSRSTRGGAFFHAARRRLRLRCGLFWRGLQSVGTLFRRSHGSFQSDFGFGFEIDAGRDAELLPEAAIVEGAAVFIVVEVGTLASPVGIV